ncbi:MAG: hypothetical protein K6T66_05415 [Peptococcaceae bacterium]|nr:hypothetical protein [Peptococcaceae bacterium]
MKNQNIKRLVWYFVYMVLIIFILVKSTDLESQFKTFVARTYSYYPFLFFQQYFCFAVGVLLAVPKFIITLMKNGSWYFDWVKFIAVGVPTFIVSIFPILLYSPVGNYIPQIGLVISYSVYPQIICAVILGYSLLSSFNKH